MARPEATPGVTEIMAALQSRKSSKHRVGGLATLMNYAGCVPSGNSRAEAQAAKKIVRAIVKRGQGPFGFHVQYQIKRVRISGKIHYCAMPRMNATRVVRRNKKRSR